MTDENDLGKCGITEAYIDKHIDNLSAGDLDLIEKIGIQLSHDEALIYANMPEFHRAFLEGAYSWHVLRIWLHSYSRNDSRTVSRLSRYLRLVERKADLVMPINDVVSLVFPFEHGAGLSFSVDLGAALSPERRFLVEVAGLVRGGWLDAIKLSVDDLNTGVVLGSCSGSGIRLPDLERVSCELKSGISQRVVKVWRQYVDLRGAVLKQGAFLSGVNSSGHVDTPDGLSIPWLLVEAKRTRKLPGQVVEAAYRLFRKRNGRNHETPAELFKLLTPEDLPEFIKWRNDQKILKAIRLTLVDDVEWNYQNFVVRHGKVVKLLKNNK